MADGTTTIDGKRVDYARDAQEFAVIGHLRGWCHNMTDCAICRADQRASAAERTLDSIISG